MRLQQPLLLFSLGVALSHAATPTSFCKCICRNNSTIIALDPPQSGTSRRALSFSFSSPLSTSPLDVQRLSRSAQDEDNDSDSDSDDEPVASDPKKFRTKNCIDCNRQFCMDYDLKICKDVEEKEISAVCFQRDSSKDQAIVFIFIFATVGLLTWALIRPWVEWWIERRRERRSYIPVTNQPDQ